MAATYLLDTTTCSDLMREHRKVASRVATLGPAGRVFICTIVRGEVCYGLQRMPRGRKRQEFEAKAFNLLATLPCEPIPERAADHYGRLKREAEKSGSRMDENDLWIAATALALDAVLVTRDKHFRRVRGLIVEDWTR
jgi:tRNA(fMet)-specific endonuclease VapC